VLTRCGSEHLHRSLAQRLLRVFRQKVIHLGDLVVVRWDERNSFTRTSVRTYRT
jgi:hypothetical protein